MSQITLELDEATRALVERAAAARGVSQSRWVAEVIQEHATHDWPKECLELAGKFADFPLRGGDDDHEGTNGLPADAPRIGF